MTVIQLGKDMADEMKSIVEKIERGRIVKLPNKFTAEKDNDDEFIIVCNNDKNTGRQSYKITKQNFTNLFLRGKSTNAEYTRKERKSLLDLLKKN